MTDLYGAPRRRPRYDDRYLDEPWFDEPRFEEPRFEEPRFDESWGEAARRGGPVDDRLTELVFLDGRLVSHTTGPVAGTSWAGFAARRDREERQPPPPPPTPRWQHVLDWLADRVGGEGALAGLDAEPLGDAPDLLAARLAASSARKLVRFMKSVTDSPLEKRARRPVGRTWFGPAT